MVAFRLPCSFVPLSRTLPFRPTVLMNHHEVSCCWTNTVPGLWARINFIFCSKTRYLVSRFCAFLTCCHLRKDFLSGAVPVQVAGIGGPGAPHQFTFTRREDAGPLSAWGVLFWLRYTAEYLCRNTIRQNVGLRCNCAGKCY